MKRFLSVLLVSCSLFASGLTQTEVMEAVYDALTAAPLNFSGSQINVVPWLYPSLQTQTLGEYLMKVFGSDDSVNPPSEGTVLSNLQALRLTLLSYGVLTSRVDSAATELESFHRDFNSFGSRWGAHAFAVEQHLQNFGYVLDDLRYLGNSLEGAARGLTNYVHTVTNQLGQILDFNDSIADGNVTFTVDLNTSGDGYDLINSVRISVDEILDLSEEYEYQLQNIGATLQLLYEWFENNGSNVEIENYLSSIATRLDGVAGSLTNVINVSVSGWQDGLAITNWPTTLTDTAWWDDMRALSYARNATLDNTYGAVTNLSGFASNILASIALTPEAQRQFDEHTNAVDFALSTNVASNMIEADNVPSVMSNGVSDITDIVDRTLTSDRFSQNPYDNAYLMEEDFSDSVESAAEVSGTDFDPEVVIFGSDSRPYSSRSGNRPDLHVRLPRLVFNAQTLTSNWGSSRVLTSVMAWLWMFIGFFAKAFIARDFLQWYSKREKRV